MRPNMTPYNISTITSILCGNSVWTNANLNLGWFEKLCWVLQLFGGYEKLFLNRVKRVTFSKIFVKSNWNRFFEICRVIDWFNKGSPSRLVRVMARVWRSSRAHVRYTSKVICIVVCWVLDPFERQFLSDIPLYYKDADQKGIGNCCLMLGKNVSSFPVDEESGPRNENCLVQRFGIVLKLKIFREPWTCQKLPSSTVPDTAWWLNGLIWKKKLTCLD